MKLTVSKEELQAKLSNVQNIAEKRTTMPILSHFLLVAQSDGSSSITATDLDTAIREPLLAEVSIEGRMCMPARKLYEIVRELEGDITLESDDAQWVRVSAGKSSFRLACLLPDEFPAWPEMSASFEITFESPAFLQMIEKTLYSAGESDTRYTLNGLLFNIIGTQIVVVGTDGHRMAVVKRTSPVEAATEQKVIVPRKAAAEIRKFLGKEGQVSMSIGANHVLFRVEGMMFLARLIEGTYPNYHQVIPQNNDKIVVLKREAFIKALKRVSVMSRERSNAVRVELAPALMKLAATNPDMGEARDEFPVNYEGDELSAGFNAKYLLDALSSMHGEEVQFELHDQLSPTLLRDTDDQDYICVVMPMRI